MKQTSTYTQDVWDSGDFAGVNRRPTCRVTIQKLVAANPQYRLDDSRSQDWAHSGGFISMLFTGGHQQPRELRNVVSVKWSRGVDSDVGTCTIVLSNIEARTGLDPVSEEEMDFPGYYTPNRGDGDYFDQWGYLKNTWANWLVPDRIIRTYEGYGTSPEAAPEHDTHLYPSGVWLIDTVTLDTDGHITLECRDLARVLLDQIIFPGIVPYGVYPLWFDVYSNRGKPQQVITPDNDSSWTIPQYDLDSNRYYAVHPELRDNRRPLVEKDSTVYGHHPRDAFDAATSTFWLSTGFTNGSDRDGYVWVQGKFSVPRSVEGVKINAQHGPYQVYISLQTADGDWVGTKRIPYKADDVDAHAAIPFVQSFPIQKGETLTVKLPKKYANIKKIRYTFGQLPGYGFGITHVHHAAINTVYYATDVTTQTQAGSWQYGNYSDYTDIVKWLLAWGGFFWPNAESGLCTQTYSDGSTQVVAPASNDPAIVDGRVWGDFENTATNGLVKFDVDTWDKKPLMDGIGVIRDITGFDFWIDETGGVVWRLPNIWTKGSYIMPTRGGPRATRTSSLVHIDERKHLIAQSVALSSKNVRERIFVANQAGNFGSVVSGYTPANVGLKRYAGWTDQKFKTKAECTRMADLIALKQSFTYRQNNLTITANPALQPDDQVLITERTTGEGYIHRILNITSDFDMDTGRWTYTLTTNWLGDEAFTNLAWHPDKLTNATRAYLYYMGHLGSLT